MLSFEVVTADHRGSKAQECFVYRRLRSLMLLFPMDIINPAYAGSGLSKESRERDVSYYERSALWDQSTVNINETFTANVRLIE